MPQPDNERIDRLEVRVDRLEDKIASDISKIFEKLHDLGESMAKGAIEAAKNYCPAPGSCLTLSDNLKHLIEAHNATMLRVERLELKMLEMDRETMRSLHRIDGQFANIEKQKAWLLGAWSVVALGAAIVGTGLTIVVTHFLGKL